MEELRKRKAFICDMDGVLYHGRTLLEGAAEFVDWLQRRKKQFLFLTNNSSRSPAELRKKLSEMDIHVTEAHFMTSAIATASFLSGQCPNGRAYVIGDAGLLEALDEAGLRTDDSRPDYVVVGETRSYDFEKIERAIRLVLGGAKLIGTNYDLTGPTEQGITPACRALVAPIELATGRKAYYVGKPNPLIMRASLKRLGARREDTAVIGDRMDTDIVAGIEAEMDTVLVLTGITRREDLVLFAYKPGHVLNHVGEICRA